MFKKGLLYFCFLLLSANYAFAQVGAPSEVDQQIDGFSVSGYGERGKKTWDLAGKSADIFDNVVKLKDITGNMYGDEQNVKLTADRGEFLKNEGKIHLEQNVVITTDSGAKMTTDSLDWDRKNQVVSTKDPVNIARENMVTTGVGVTGHPQLNQVTLEKDVQVDILPKEEAKDKAASGQEKVVINCDGPLVIDYDKNVATFNKNVKVDRDSMQLYSDTMDVYFNTAKKEKGNEEKEKAAETKEKSNDAKQNNALLPAGMGGSKVEKIIARGNVKIVRGENVSYSDEATYIVAEKKIILSGQPRLVINSTEGFKNASFGN